MITSEMTVEEQQGVVSGHFKAGRYAAMEAAALEMVELNPNEGVNWKALATAQQLQGKDSYDAAKRAAEILPNSASVLSTYGTTLMARGMLEDAVDVLKKSVSINPESSSTYNNLGYALFGLSRHSEAIEAYGMAINADPGNAAAWNNIANSYMGIGRQKDALACFRKAIEIKPDYSVAHSNLIFLMDLMGEFTIQELQAERRRWAEIHARKFYPPGLY